MKVGKDMLEPLFYRPRACYTHPMLEPSTCPDIEHNPEKLNAAWVFKGARAQGVVRNY